MQDPQPFVVPAGVTFLIADDGVVIANRGDIVLHTNFGRALKSIVSQEGSVTIHAPVEGGEIHAAGGVTIHGDTHADSIRAGGDVVVAGTASVGTLQAGGGVGVHGSAGVGHLHAGGSVAIHGDASTNAVEVAGDFSVGGGLSSNGTVRAGGALTVAGAVKADGLFANVVDLRGAAVTARGIQGGSAVHIGAARLQVDAILAPEVQLDRGTSGRATIVESQNDLGPTAIKGGFRLVDYAEMFGDPAAFLAERGLAPLGSAPAPVAVSAPPAPVVSAPVVASHAGDPAAHAVEAAPVPAYEPAEPTEEVHEAAPAVEAAPAEASAQANAEEAVEIEPEETEPTADPPTSHIEASSQEPVSIEVDEASEEVTPPEHPLHKQLAEAVGKITDCYGDSEIPPAVNHLMDLIERRQYEQVRAEITSIWSDLLKYHQKKGVRIPHQHQVTTTFNTINSLVKKM